MVPCGSYIVITDKVFTENGYNKGDSEYKALLESVLGHPVIVIPWTPHEDVVYGHADGFIKWCGDNRILMGNHGDCYPEEAAYIRRILESYGFEVTEMRFKGKVDTPCYDLNWAYINFLQVGKNIIMPKFNIKEDTIALQYIQKCFPRLYYSSNRNGRDCKRRRRFTLFKLECLYSKITYKNVNYHL